MSSERISTNELRRLQERDRQCTELYFKCAALELALEGALDTLNDEGFYGIVKRLREIAGAK